MLRCDLKNQRKYKKRRIESMLPVPGVHVSALLPYDAGSLLSHVREYGNVDSVDYRADGIWIERMWTADSPPRSSIGRSMRRTVMAAITSMPSMMSIECSTHCR